VCVKAFGKEKESERVAMNEFPYSIIIIYLISPNIESYRCILFYSTDQKFPA